MGAGSERQVIAVFGGSGIGDISTSRCAYRVVVPF